MNSADSSHQ